MEEELEYITRVRKPVSGGGRKRVIPVRFSDKEYRHLIDAAYHSNCMVSTLLANSALLQAKRIMRKVRKLGKFHVEQENVDESM